MNIVITGAGKGIGFELSKIFAENNHRVVAISRNINALNDIHSLTPISFDLNQHQLIPGLCKQIASELGQIDILINNAGALSNKPFVELKYEDFTEMYNLNVFVPFTIVQNFFNSFSSGAHIVNIGSMGGVHGSSKYPGLSLYSSSKAALACLTESMAVELKDKNLRFNCLALGAVQTEMFSDAFPGFTAPVQPAQMAHFIYDFSLNAAKVMNGKIIPVALSNP